MAKPKRKRKRPSHGSGPTPPSEEALFAELELRVQEIASSDPAETGPLWGAAHKLLLKVGAAPDQVARLVATRDGEALGPFVAALRAGETPTSIAPAVPEGAAAGPEIPHETLKHALRAFRKRLKLTRLDHESKLGVGPMTGGRKSDFDAILAPQEYGREVWDALAAAGKLRAMGGGFYQLTDEEPGD